MDTLGTSDLRKVVESLMQVTKCAVCLDVLKLDTVVCVNGHVICADCKRTQPSCPTCRKEFSNVENTAFVRQVLEVIPHTCRHKGCPHVVYKGDDHEQYCKYRHTRCRHTGCSWEGCVKDLLQHCKSHTGLTIATNAIQATITSFHFKEIRPVYFIFYDVFSQFFWEKQEYNPNSGVMTFTVFPELTEKPKNDFYYGIKFYERDKNEKITTITKFSRKVNFDQEEGLINKNTINVPITILLQFWDEKNLKLEYTSFFDPNVIALL